MKKIVLATILSLFVSSGLPAQGVSGRGKLRGIVFAEDTGEPLAGVTVQLYSLRARAYLKPFPKTGRDGKWKAYFIQGGTWNIDFIKPGYETKKITFEVDTRPGSKRPLINIRLRKTAGPALRSDIVKEIEIGTNFFKEGKFAGALQKFKEIVQNYQESSGVEIVYKLIGNCYAGLKDYPRAIAAYEKALQKFPAEPELIISIGNAYTNSGKLDRALEYFSKLPFEKIDNQDTLYNMGIIYYNGGKYRQAVQYFKKAVQIDDKFAEAFFRLGMSYTAYDKIEDAVRAFKKFMELAPDSPNYQTAKAITDAFSEQSR